MTTTAVASHWCLLEWVPLESYQYVSNVKIAVGCHIMLTKSCARITLQDSHVNYNKSSYFS